MATVRTDRRIDRHSNVWLIHGAFLRCDQQKNFAAHARERNRSDGMSMRSDLQAPPNQEPQEKKKWVEPVAALVQKPFENPNADPAGAAGIFGSWIPEVGRVKGSEPDRKSTRLNSSHTVISYDVF